MSQPYLNHKRKKNKLDEYDIIVSEIKKILEIKLDNKQREKFFSDIREYISPMTFWFIINSIYFPYNSLNYFDDIDNVKNDINVLTSPSMMMINDNFIKEEISSPKFQSDKGKRLSLITYQKLIKSLIRRVTDINSTRLNNLINKVKHKIHYFCMDTTSDSLIIHDPLLRDFYYNFQNRLDVLYDHMFYNKIQQIESLYYTKKKCAIADELKPYSEGTEWRCFVCHNTSALCSENRTFYECESCGITVHQPCYGIDQNKESMIGWKCDPCREIGIQNGQNLSCLLCPIKGGAMKQTTITTSSPFYKTILQYKRIEYPTDNTWIHLSCALWNNNVIIGNQSTMSNISFEEDEIRKEMKGYCSICKHMNNGPVVKCKEKDCTFRCHPECARMNNCYMEIEEEDHKFTYSIFCYNHYQHRESRTLNKWTAKYTSDIRKNYKGIKSLMKIYDNKKTN